MKKRIWIFLVLLIISLVAGCGGQAAAVNEPATDTAVALSSLGPDVDVATVSAIKDRADVLVLDVREPWEYEEAHIPGVTLIPMAEVPGRLDEIPTDKEVIVTCRSGNRSGQVTEFLRQQGYDNVHNMQGGILAWQAARLPVE
jgi:phage shock protein E